MLFPDESPKTLQKSVDRLIAHDVLRRASKRCVYLYSRFIGPYPLERLAEKIFDEATHNYISLESALSQYGVISQNPHRQTYDYVQVGLESL